MTIKIVLLGGSGFVGQGILDQLAKDPQFKITSISRSGGSLQLKEKFPQVNWLKIDLQKKTPKWAEIIADQDWVVDLLGVLVAKNQQVYQQLTIKPILPLIAAIKENQSVKMLFVSAKTAPRLLKNYLVTKRETEKLLRSQLKTRAVFLYPSLIYHPQRQSTWILAQLLLFGQHLPLIGRHLTKWQPLSRQQFALEVKNVLLGGRSQLLQKEATT
ncbi:NAD(P)H-binding protein [Liquorilactobacillus sicerae]|uniref:NAD(P)H-binding protein n=1 Tax=Liquorilactobacillus sicerae TaxID=1416943 RepID=UPI0024815E44|nr:NAD(P)H-binding protein [Liquorilactobacillus sicerae]